MEPVDTPAPGIPENFKEEQHHYRKSIQNPDVPRHKNNLFIKKTTDVKKSVAYCIDLIYNKQYPFVKISAISSNMDKAILIVELLKRKIKNLHQINTLETFEFDEVFTPKREEEGRHEFSIKKFSTNLVVKLVRVQPSNIKTYGYQPPIQISLVSTKDPREYINYVLNETREPKKKKLMNQQRRRDDDRQDNHPGSKRNSKRNNYRKQEEKTEKEDDTYGKIKMNDIDKPKKKKQPNKRPKKQKETQTKQKYDDSDDNIMYQQKVEQLEKSEQDASSKKKNKKRNKKRNKPKQAEDNNGYMRRDESLDYVQKQ